MSDVQFEEEKILNTARYSTPSTKGMIGYLLKKGLAKSENVAQLILLGVAIFFFIMSALAFVIL